MENFSSDTQIHEYPLSLLSRLFLGISFLFIFSLAIAQDTSKRAEKLTFKAKEEESYREFDKAKELLQKAIKVDPTYINAYLRLASIYRLYQRSDSAAMVYNQMVDHVAPEKVGEANWGRIAVTNYQNGEYARAKSAIGFTTRPDSFLLRSIDFSLSAIQNSKELEIIELPQAINSYQLQYFPVLTVDENTIIYTKRNSDHPSADEDLVISSKINGEWIPSQSISQAINTPFNEGACSISADGNILIFTACEGRKVIGNCDLFITKRTGGRWSEPENLGAVINSPYWDSQPSLSADGRTLYFSSNRPGGFGKRDLWVSTRFGEDWSTPQNLGDIINTPFDETTPFIHANNELLFFSSSGLPGLGGFDLYYTEKADQAWTIPNNLGYPINSHGDEISLFINAAGTTGYFAREPQNDQNRSETRISQFQIPFDSLVRNKSSYVTGKVVDAKSGKPIGCTIEMTELNTDTESYLTNSDSITGRYFLVVASAKEYGVFIQKPGYLFNELTFMPQSTSLLEPDTIDIQLDKLEVGKSTTMRNVYFESDKSTLNPKSKFELNSVRDFLMKNQDLRFEIQGHTDSVGQENYNRALSEERAKAVKDFLVLSGINPIQLAVKGFGSTMPIAENNSEEGRQANRRITFQVVSSN
ncbi:MAG: OOP family OmpA-OmpF porin [Marinoscillum sp.]|jgi:OOP family OmpA-OmpF porin